MMQMVCFEKCCGGVGGSYSSATVCATRKQVIDVMDKYFCKKS